ncbi:hypothetical protein ACOSQ4_013841 [Xanthoceras sorbifolium]
MPLYDCMLLLKPSVKKEALMELVARVGKHVYTKNGVLTDLKSFGTIQLGYGIKKLDGRYFQNSEAFYSNMERFLFTKLSTLIVIALAVQIYGYKGFLGDERISLLKSRHTS